MKKTKSTMKRMFSSPSRRRLRNNKLNKDNSKDSNNNEKDMIDNAIDDNMNRIKGNNLNINDINQIPSSIESDDQAMGLGMGLQGLGPPSITRTNKATTDNKSSGQDLTGAAMPPADVRLDETKGHVEQSFSPFDHVSTASGAGSNSVVTDANRAEEEHRKNAFLYLERYEDMVRAQDHEDETTIGHLRPIFYTIRRLAISDGSDEPQSNPAGVSATVVDRAQAVEETPEEEGGKGEILQKDAFISVLNENAVAEEEGNDADDEKEELATPLEDIIGKADTCVTAGEDQDGGAKDKDKRDDDDDEFNVGDTKDRGLGKANALEVEQDYENEGGGEGSHEDIPGPPTDLDRQGNSITSVVIETDDEEEAIELETTFDNDLEEKAEEGIETVAISLKECLDEDDDENEKQKQTGDTSFTANNDGTFMENDSTHDQAAKSTADVTRDTSFTANHEQTFMKLATPSDEITTKAVSSNANGKATGKDNKIVTEDSKGEDSNYKEQQEGVKAPPFVSAGYLDTTTNTITDPNSFNNDHNVVLSFDAITQFVDKIKVINETSGNFPSGPKSDYHILQTDAQLMLILTTISETTEEYSSKEGEGDEQEGKEGLTFAEFVHVYKNVIAGMQTLQMLPTSADTSIATFDPTRLNYVRDVTRERTLQMIRAFTTRSIDDLENIFGKDDEEEEEEEETVEEKVEDKGEDKILQRMLSDKDTELENLKNELKQAKERKVETKQSKLPLFVMMLFSLVCGAAIGHQYFTYQSNELAKLDIIEVKGKLNSANKEIKLLGIQVDDLNSDLKKKESSLSKKDEEYLKCQKTLRSIEDYYNGDVTALKRELEECQESSKFNPSESNVQEAKMVIKSSQSLQKVVLHRQVMTAVGTALIAAVPSFLKFLLNVLFF
eukprot:CAMPEP_0203686314 /NCGR_PEP_ID=MMETSP0090-20130426/48994_1 /ASSEMBLY_ACC=CAM_ASM_001088 /TAXON_ID=426623 /ORGANISM="Chaetoceros affinis, Strain CCMP159" /LENGTH=895 /DNA_ID=CAMNT_0050555535 /DNA_START=387 /DNA_END=3074 /DNA_ORIENTATION=+